MNTNNSKSKNDASSVDLLSGYAEWLHLHHQKGISSLSWYVSPIRRMLAARIADEEFAACTDIDDLIARANNVSSIWDLGPSRRRTYLRNVVRMYRAYLHVRAADQEKEDCKRHTSEMSGENA